MNLRGKTAIVTGGAAGIGLATATRLVRAGSRVTLWDLNVEGLEAAAAELRSVSGEDAVFVHRCDVTDTDRVQALVDQALEEMGGIDILVNNAGHVAPGDFLDQPASVWKTTVRVNFEAIISVTHAVLPHLYRRGSGHVVNVSSAAGLVGVPGLAVYSATKWAVWGLTEALREEAKNAGKPGVRFSSIHPNYVAHGMFEGARMTGLGGVFFPILPDHDVVAKAIVESALKRGRRCPKRPRSLRTAVLLRGLLPDAWFNALSRVLNVHASMNTWRGRS
jgi:all-trans-retinol dehydrogenase (NAD+)